MSQKNKMTLKKENKYQLKESLNDFFSVKKYWYVFSFITLISLNHSLYLFLASMIYIEHPVLNVIIPEAVNILLSGWLFFTVFYRPNSGDFIPSEKVRDMPYEEERMQEMFFLVLILRFIVFHVLILLGYISNDELFSPEYPTQAILGILIIIAIILMIKLYFLNKKYKLNNNLDTEDLIIQAYGCQIPLEKFKNNLSIDEQNELLQLEYETRKLLGITVVSVAKIVARSIILSVLFEVAIQIIARL